MPADGWEKGDIVRDMVVHDDDRPIPRKPGSRRTDRTLSVRSPKAPSAPSRRAPKASTPSSPIHVLLRSSEDERWSTNVERAATAVGRKLERKNPGLERLSVRVEDVNGPRGGHDKLCRVKAVWDGRPSVVVSHQAETVMPAVRGALSRLDRTLAEKSDRRVRQRRRAG
jgi:hypothetical protein